MAKAKIKQNAWGNWYGYIGTRKVAAFSNSPTQSQEDAAKEWLDQQMPTAKSESEDAPAPDATGWE